MLEQEDRAAAATMRVRRGEIAANKIESDKKVAKSDASVVTTGIEDLEKEVGLKAHG